MPALMCEETANPALAAGQRSFSTALRASPRFDPRKHGLKFCEMPTCEEEIQHSPLWVLNDFRDDDRMGARPELQASVLDHPHHIIHRMRPAAVHKRRFKTDTGILQSNHETRYTPVKRMFP